MKKKYKISFVVYSCDREVIVTTPALEKRTIKEYFTKGGRSLDDYDRGVLHDRDDPAVVILPRVYCDLSLSLQDRD